MKFIKIILAVIILVSTIMYPVSLFAQSNLLPEKTNDSSVQTENNTSVPVATPESLGAEKNVSSEEGSWIGVTLAVLLVALLFIFLEIAVIPGFGVCGIMGGILLLCGLGLAYWKLSTMTAVIISIIACVGVLLLVAFMIWVFPTTSMGKKFILQEKSVQPEDYLAVSEFGRFVGAEGVAVSNLRPSGIAKIAGERIDVITEGDFVEKGTKIKVIKTTAGKVIVAPVEE